MIERLIRIGDAASQLCNATFFNGHPNESLSGRSYRQSLWTEKWIDRLFWLQERHCRSAHENDVKYAEELLLNRDRRYSHGEGLRAATSSNTGA